MQRRASVRVGVVDMDEGPKLALEPLHVAERSGRADAIPDALAHAPLEVVDAILVAFVHAPTLHPVVGRLALLQIAPVLRVLVCVWHRAHRLDGAAAAGDARVLLRLVALEREQRILHHNILVLRVLSQDLHILVSPQRQAVRPSRPSLCRGPVPRPKSKRDASDRATADYAAVLVQGAVLVAKHTRDLAVGDNVHAARHVARGENLLLDGEVHLDEQHADAVQEPSAAVFEDLDLREQPAADLGHDLERQVVRQRVDDQLHVDGAHIPGSMEVLLNRLGQRVLLRDVQVRDVALHRAALLSQLDHVLIRAHDTRRDFSHDQSIRRHSDDEQHYAEYDLLGAHWPDRDVACCRHRLGDPVE
eukprot:145369-Rhodomonas_salina.3